MKEVPLWFSKVIHLEDSQKIPRCMYRSESFYCLVCKCVGIVVFGRGRTGRIACHASANRWRYDHNSLHHPNIAVQIEGCVHIRQTILKINTGHRQCQRLDIWTCVLDKLPEV